MQICQPLDAALCASDLELHLRNRGLVIASHDNLASFAGACREIEFKPRITPPLSPAFFDIDPSDLLWLSAHKDNHLVAVVALKHEKITVSLAAHLDQQYRRIYCDPDNEDPVIDSHAPAADFITGSIVYHGDLFVTPDMRGKRLAHPLGKLSMILAYLKWSPDYIWGYISREQAERGYGVRMGYNNTQPMGTVYRDDRAPDNIRFDDWLVWATHEDLTRACSLEARRRRIKPVLHDLATHKE